MKGRTIRPPSREVRGLIYRPRGDARVARRRTVLTVVAGLCLVGASFLLLFGQLVEHDLGETLAFLPLIVGIFLVGDGVIAAWREKRLRPKGP